MNQVRRPRDFAADSAWSDRPFLDAVLALFRNLLRDGRARLAKVLDRQQDRATRAHERRRLVEQPPWLLVAVLFSNCVE